MNSELRFVLMLVGLVACSMSRLSGQELAEAETEKPDIQANAVSVEDVVDDSAICDRLTRVFDSTGWYDALAISCDNGIVTLAGQADNEEHRVWAEEVSQRTEDVIAVVNKLTVDANIDFSNSASIIHTSLGAIWREFLVRLPLLIAAAMVLLATVIFAKVVRWVLVRLLDERSVRASLKDLCYQLSSIGIWIAGILVAIVIAFPGMTPSKALTLLGLGSVAIGFAFKDIFENFFAGVLILWRYPFDRGDFISSGDLTGSVEQITIRNTMIRRLDGELAVVPNATIFKNTVDVLTDRPQRRVRLLCGVAYKEDIDHSREVITAAVRGCETVEGKRMVQVFANELADSCVSFEVVWWTGAKPVEIRRSRDEVISAIKRALDAEGIEIPFPHRTLVFRNAPQADVLPFKTSLFSENPGSSADINRD